MLFIDTIRLAFRALLRNRTRTFLTMLGIIIGISSVIIMMSLGGTLTAYMNNQFSSIGTNIISIRGAWDRSSGDWRMLHEMDETDYKAIRDNCHGIAHISPISYSASPFVFGNNSTNSSLEGGNEDYLAIRSYKIVRGAMFDAADVASAAQLCLLSQGIADDLFTNGEDPIGQTVRCGKIPMLVIGILKQEENKLFGDDGDVVVVPYTTVMKRLEGSTAYNSLAVCSENHEDNGRLVNEIEQVMRIYHGLKPDQRLDVEIEVFSESMETLSKILDIVVLVLSLIAAISLVVGGVGIMNIMYVTVTERTREIGLRKAIGARRRNIMTQFLVESVVLSLAGGFFGALAGMGIYAAACALAKLPFVFNTSAVLISFGVCTLVGVFFGWYPARKAAALDPTQALRYE